MSISSLMTCFMEHHCKVLKLFYYFIIYYSLKCPVHIPLACNRMLRFLLVEKQTSLYGTDLIAELNLNHLLA